MDFKNMGGGEKEMMSLFKQVDKNRDNELQFTEFVHLIYECRERLNMDVLHSRPIELWIKIQN